jgi:hypothetical protein
MGKNGPRNKNRVHSGLHAHMAGSASEHLVVFDLYRRGVLEITWPDIQQSKDDLHAKFKSGWRSIQVKAAPVNIKTGRVMLPHKKDVTSDIVAFVGFALGKIRYETNSGYRMPTELGEKLACQYINADVLAANVRKNELRATRKRKRLTRALVVG